MAELAVKVLLSHLLGDFVFRTNRMMHEISIRKFRSPYLYIHLAIHLLLLLLATSFQKTYVIPVLVLTASHFLIETGTKFFLFRKNDGLTALVTEQTLHLIALAVFTAWFYPFTTDPGSIFNAEVILLLTVLIILTFATSVFIKKAMSYFNYSMPAGGLTEAGRYIGILERLFILLFVMIPFWEGIGYLLAAKSIFRFGDLKENKDIRLTEYILIGTLLSFAIAISVSLLYINIRKKII